MTIKNATITAGLILLSSAAWVLGAGSPTQVDFKVKHELGKVTRLKLVTKTVGTIKMPDPLPEQRLSNVMKQEYLSKCIKINPDGSAVYAMSMPWMDMEMDYAGFKSRFSSSGSQNQAASSPSPSTQPGMPDFSGKVLSAMTRATFTLVVDRNGKPLKVQGFTDSMNKALQNMGDLRPEEKAVSNSLRQAFSDEFMLEQMKYRYRLYPPHPQIKIGETWTSTDRMNMPMFRLNTTNITTYKLVGIEEFHGRPCIKLQGRETVQIVQQPKSQSKPAASQPQNPFDKMDLTFKSNEGNAIAYVDYQTGDVVQLHKTQRMVSEITMPQPATTQGADQAKPFRIQQSMNISFSMELLPETSETIPQNKK